MSLQFWERHWCGVRGGGRAGKTGGREAQHCSSHRSTISAQTCHLTVPSISLDVELCILKYGHNNVSKNRKNGKKAEKRKVQIVMICGSYLARK